MTTAGWLIMFLSVGSVTLLFAWCLFQIIFGSRDRRLHGIDDIDTHGD
ncbi:MAG: hypothetical protein JXA30_12390 [Deltaproteobacteria bacterium]|nr:hypothetical protein [Deltaproteobacteria bacterium]